MRKLNPALIGILSAASLTIAGAAYAQPADGPHNGGHRGQMMGPITKAQAEQHADKAFARLDANGDGVITPEDRKARGEKRFAKLDTNNDGVLSKEEFSARGNRMGKMHGDKKGKNKHHMGRMGRGGMGHTKMADTNNDGQISAAEFKAAAATRFAKADANNDGTVTMDERRTAMKAMHEARKAARAARQSAAK